VGKEASSVAKTGWHHYDFGDYRIGVTPIDGAFALLFLVDDTAYPLAYYPNEEVAAEALRVLDAAIQALGDFKAPTKLKAKKKDKGKPKSKKKDEKKSGKKAGKKGKKR
jgi:hypothetical protein